MNIKNIPRQLLGLLLVLVVCISQLPIEVSSTTIAKAETVVTPSGIEGETEATAVPSNTPSEETPAPSPVSTGAAMKTAQIRMVFTTDLHGRLTTTNYETGETYKEGSLARAATLIEEARTETGASNTFLFDIGDVLYDYSTDFIYDYDESAVQPMYSAMATMGYDAITLGNHEFDYDLSYIQEQIKAAGLADICVTSNIKSANTGKAIWNENKILTRTVTTVDGNTMDIKIGIVGETPPSLSTRRTKYTGILKTEDIVENTKKQAAILKEKGADMVVVLAHSGIGEETPITRSSNAAYALTKIEDVDVVLCGHLHQYFPSNSSTSKKYYNLPGVDAETGLANGKNLIMIADQGKAIGVADLTVQSNGESFQITDRASSIRKTTEDVKANEAINTGYIGAWKNILISQYSTILGELEKGQLFNNYFGTIEDNSAVQLLNNAKIDYALKAIKTEATAYKNKPVLAASNYIKCGSGDSTDYVSISDNFLESYLSDIQMYKSPYCLYEITGKQLREWMEWSASAYKTQTSDSNSSLTNLTSPSQDLLNEDWDENWNNFYVFDGLEYVIDTSQEPRYDVNGTKISDSSRIKSLTINGTPINDTETFVITCNKLGKNVNDLITEINSQLIYSSNTLRGRTILKEYIEKISMNGTLKDIQDDNWTVELPTDRTLTLKSGSNSETIALQKSWITKLLDEDGGYKFYEADFSKRDTTDTKGPNIVAKPLTESTTNKNVSVAVQATDRSGVQTLKYALGRFTATSSVWDFSQDITSKTFSCSENGVYSVLAIDGNGNRSVYYVRINNINKSAIQAPIVDTFTNRKTKLTGTTDAKAKVYIQLSNGKTYTATANSSGKFSRTLPAQNAGKTIYVYAIDSKGRTSARTVVTVERTGPNKPSANQVNSNSKTISGKLNDSYTTPMLCVDDTKIYVPDDGGKEIYQTSKSYDKTKKIIEVETSIKSDGTFTMKLPTLIKGGKKVVFFTVDNVGRKSLNNAKTVVQQVPNKPTVLNEKVTNITTTIKVSSEERCSIHVKTNGKTYSHRDVEYDSTKKRYIYAVSIPRTNSGVVLYVYASNSKGKSRVVRITKKESAPNTPKLDRVRVNQKKITGSVHLINKDGKRSNVSVSESKTKVYVKVNNKTYRAKVYSNGRFRVNVKKIKKGSKIVYWASNVNGTGKKGAIRVNR